MSAPVISIRGIGKRFLIGDEFAHGTLRDHLTAGFRRLLGKEKRKPASEHWALRDVSFDVKEGEVVGIIGHNGAGKSTLLKILSQITEPSEGEIRVIGRLACLLEAGTGFHPELTGRENVFLNGAILGMSHAEIRRKFDEIVAFSGVEVFIDTPVKRYSSGMQMRLAFAVAAHLEPEILVVDEVLAVGDAEFQKKCLGKMQSLSTTEGRTVLFVSHNLTAVQQLCTSALLLDHGKVRMQGDTRSVVTDYLSMTSNAGSEVRWTKETAPGNHEVKLHCLRVSNQGGDRGRFSTNEDLFIEMEFHAHSIPNGLKVGFDIVTAEGERVVRSYHNDPHPDDWPKLQVGVNVLRCVIPRALLNCGDYFVSAIVGMHSMDYLVNLTSVVQFSLTLDHGVSPYWSSIKSKATRPGVICPIFPWQSLNPSQP